MPIKNLPPKIELIINSKEKDLGGFSVRRVLPYATHRMVGPFIFFDHIGPAQMPVGQGMDVRPHPHINLATVTYLFEGKITHRDSLGSHQDIEPGAVNWMTAGRGIVHSERTPQSERDKGAKSHGIQLWVALPEEFEETDPSFTHIPKEDLPQFTYGDGDVKLLLGKAFGQSSPAPIHSDLFYAEVKLKKGRRFQIPAEGRDTAIYLVQGQMNVEGETVNRTDMVVAKSGENLSFTALEDSHVMILGGTPVGERFIFWNFVSSSPERLEEAKKLWAPGPSLDNPRFHPIDGDDREHIPLPEDFLRPKGTIL